MFVSNQNIFDSRNSVFKRASQNFAKNFGQMLGRPAPPRLAGPTQSCFGKEPQMCRVQADRPHSGRPALLLRSCPVTTDRELHHLQGYASDIRRGTFATVEGRLASPRPAGLASARRYKIRRQRRPSMHHMLRFARSSLITSISSPFLEFLCLIKLF